MQRFAWVTDIHLNFLPWEGVRQFLDELAARRLDGLLVGGDIAEAPDVVGYLEQLDDALGKPIYFVLGNHDYYHGSIGATRAAIASLCVRRPRLHYLSVSGPIELAPRLGLVGHDGWADGRIGDYGQSLISLQDYQFIADLADHSKASRWPLLKHLGDEAAGHLRRVLPPALDRFDHVLLLTHVPPLREACWHEGRIADDQWAPHFTCQAVGEAILEIMRGYPHRQLTVLCGHTHGAGETRPLDNVLIVTGGADYGRPTVQREIEEQG